MATPQPDWKPTNKLLYGSLSAITTAIVIAIASSQGKQLDPGVAGAVVTAVFAVVGYMIPNKYRFRLDDADAIAQLLVQRHPNLNPDVVKRVVENPEKTATLIEDPNALQELVRMSARGWIR
jgi:hypothetical protein